MAGAARRGRQRDGVAASLPSEQSEAVARGKEIPPEGHASFLRERHLYCHGPGGGPQPVRPSFFYGPAMLVRMTTPT
jgi:hypothetical protein